jgi:Repeat of unknown function (DUF5648)
MKLNGISALCLAAISAVVSGPAAALFVSFHPQYGEFVDRGVITIGVSPSDDARIDCDRPLVVSRNGHQFVLVAVRLQGVRTPNECFQMAANIGPLSAGTYTIEARLPRLDGSSVDEVQKETIVVLPLEGRCNADPLLRPSLIGYHATLTSSEFAQKVATDAQYAASIENPLVELGPPPVSLNRQLFGLTYPPLEDVTVLLVKLAETGQFALSRNGRACFSAAPPDVTASFIEFYHSGLDHYFYSGNAGEIADIDAGKVGPWARTGKFFRAVTEPGCYFSTTDTSVYRFFGIPGAGPNSHFFTRDRAECYVVDKSAQWSLEGVPFFATEPRSDGTCPAPFAQTRIPLYRVWRPFGDSNHRFTTDRAVVNEMVQKGWLDEGAAMCVLPPAT